MGRANAPHWRALTLVFNAVRKGWFLRDQAAQGSLVLAPGAAFVGIVFLAQGKTDGSSRKLECVAQRIEQIALVGIRYRLSPRAENDKARWAAFWLGHIVQS